VLVVPCEGKGVFKRSALAFSASSAAMILACFVRASALCAMSFVGFFVSAVVSPAFGRISGSCVVV
jgi:hypothetical protein